MDDKAAAQTREKAGRRKKPGMQAHPGLKEDGGVNETQVELFLRAVVALDPFIQSVLKAA